MRPLRACPIDAARLGTALHSHTPGAAPSMDMGTSGLVLGEDSSPPPLGEAKRCAWGGLHADAMQP